MSAPRLDKRNLIERAGIYDATPVWAVLTRRIVGGVYRTEMGQPGQHLKVAGTARVVGYQPSEVLARFYHEEIKTWAHEHTQGNAYDPPGMVAETRESGQLCTALPDGTRVITRRGEVIGFQLVVERDGEEQLGSTSADHLTILRRHDRAVMEMLGAQDALYVPQRPSWLPDRTPPAVRDTTDDWLL